MPKPKQKKKKISLKHRPFKNKNDSPREEPAAKPAPGQMPDDWRGMVYQALSQAASPKSPGPSALAPGQILARMGLKRKNRTEVLRALRDLAAEGRIVALKDGRFARGPRAGEAIGRLKAIPGGRTILIFDAPYVLSSLTYDEAEVERGVRDTALGGDRVRVSVSLPRGERRLQARVLEILERGLSTAVGQYFGDDRGGVVRSRQKALDGREIGVGASGALAGAKHGQWVVAKITEYAPEPEPLRGKVVEVLGDYDEPGVDITVLLRSQGCRERFPDEALAEAEAFPAEISPKEAARREDVRPLPTFTIDGADAKDFDDAISIEAAGPNRWRLGVHIADVAHYVREDTALDREATDRATSIYPLDRVVPMLPERLSNDLCSLRPGVDRLAMTCFMDVDVEGQVSNYQLRESIIHSNWRLTYEQVQEGFQAADDGQAPPDNLKEVWPALAEARRLAQCLIEMKRRRGALDLDTSETIVKLDKDGRTIGIEKRERLEAHRVIEEFMTLCNEVVGRHMRRAKLPTLYRVHDEPDIEAVERLAPALRGTGIPVSFRDTWTPQQIQAALARTFEREAGHLLRRLVLRAMKKAIYTPENRGHFGLGSECYLHFTSPIRRYPDLIVHRVLKESMAPEGISRARRDHLEDMMPDLGRHCSARERESMAIEWDAATLKSLEYMLTRVGETFDGFVSGAARVGAFVELSQIPVEGVIAVSDLAGWWEFDRETLSLAEERTGRRLRVGDPVEVAVRSVDPPGLRMELELMSSVPLPSPSEKREERDAKRAAKAEIPSRGAGDGPPRRGKARKTQAPPWKKGGRRFKR